MAKSRRKPRLDADGSSPSDGPVIDWHAFPAPGEQASALADALRNDIEEDERVPHPSLKFGHDQGLDSPGNLFNFSENFRRIFRPEAEAEPDS